MIQITSIENLLVICHLPAYKGKGAACYLHSRFFPPGLWQRLRALPFFSTADGASYMLNSKEDREAGLIFGKMQQEAASDYLFTADLQRTYLIELVHLLLKVHQKQQPA
ncbi:MAG: hypothetical protein IBJ09_09695 [Bacteroidia bacterium]|nr:hypothetical protein [Bacteroidia bacterium]